MKKKGEGGLPLPRRIMVAGKARRLKRKRPDCPACGSVKACQRCRFGQNGIMNR